MQLLIQGGRLITLNARHSIVDADVAVVGDRIAGIGSRSDLVARHGEPQQTLDASGRYVIPGLVNAHTHAFQSAFRGLGDGLSLPAWQQQVTQPAYHHLTAEDAYWFTLLGCIENVRTGVSAVVNFQAFPNDFEACSLTARAFGEVGLRGLLVKAFYGAAAPAGLQSQRSQVMEDVERCFSELHSSHYGRVRFCIGPPKATNAPGDWVQEAHAIASRHESGIHVHVGERVARSASPQDELEVAHFASLGVIDTHFIAAHCVDITEAEMELLATHGAHIAHCPVSNMYLGTGVANVPGFRAAGINVALGSDGPASNNNQDMFVVMKVASLIHKVTRLDPSMMAPGDVLEMAARNGARAASVDAGTIEPGRLADLAVVDLSGAHNQPVHRPVSALVYTAHSHDVESLVVGGEIVMRDRQLVRVDEGEVIREATRRAKQLVEKSGQASALKPSWPWS